MQNTNSAVTLAPDNSTLTFAKKIFSAPLFLTFLICSTVTLIANVVLTVMGYSPMELLAYILTPGSNILASGFMGYAENAVVSQLVSTVPNIMMLAGLWIVFFNALGSSSEKGYRIGFTTVQVVRFNMFIITGVLLLTTSINLIRWMERTSALSSLVPGYKVGIILVALLIAFYNFKVLALFSFIKETVCEGTPITQTSLFVALLCIIWGGVYALVLVFRGIELGAGMMAMDFLLPAIASVLQSVCSILLGCFVLVYRAKIKTLVTE